MIAAAYGPSADQAGDLYLPARPRPPVVCLLHGGFWRMPHARDQLARVAEALAGDGFAVWNLGYRRVGAPGGGWPGTLEDAAAGISHLVRLQAEGHDLDLAPGVDLKNTTPEDIARTSVPHATYVLERASAPSRLRKFRTLVRRRVRTRLRRLKSHST